MPSGRPFPIKDNDCELFEQDMNPDEYEYFQKHAEAFRTMWYEKDVADKIIFVEEFYDYSKNYGFIKEFPMKVGSKQKFFDTSKDFLVEHFSRAKMTVAKNIVQQIALIASNRDKILSLGSLPRSKDPFYSIETRETFRTFFGEPGQTDTFKKSVATMPLYTKFGGAICRILRRWVEGYTVPTYLQKTKSGERPPPMFNTEPRSKPTRTKASEKSEDYRGSKVPRKPDERNVSGSFGVDVKNKTSDKKEGKKEESKGSNPGTKMGAQTSSKTGGNTKGKEIAKEKPKPKPRRKHHCGNCGVVEALPKLYKKCALCKGVGTRFYCSKDCQADDWIFRHRDEHKEKGVPEF